MAGIVTSNKTRKLVGNRLKEIDVPTTTLNTALYYADLTAQGAAFTAAHVNAELNAYPTVAKNNASLALTPSANKAGVVYAMNGDSKTLEEFEFQRGSGATYFDASGVMQLAAANVPRINYENGVSKGLLIEPASSNLVLYSGMGNYGAFQALFSGDRARCSLVTEVGKSAIKVTPDISFRLSSINIQASKVYTYSFWIKAVSSFPMLIRNYDTASYTPNIIAITTDWQRVVKTFISNPNTAFDILHMSNNSGGNHPEMFIADIQLEEGPVATSYIPTTTAIATRLADKVLSKRPTAVFNKNSMNVKTAEWPATWMGNGVDNRNIVGRNFLKNSNSSNLFPSSFGSVITNVGRVAVSEWNTTNASRVLITGGANVIKSALNLYLPKNGERVSASGWFRNNHSSNSMIVSSNQGSKNIVIAPGQQFKLDFGNIEGNGVGLVQFQLRTYDAAHDIDFSYWNLKCEKGAFITAWQPATEDYIKVDENGNIEISYTEPIHLQQFSLISRELSQEEV
jgi:hypothetical protein